MYKLPVRITLKSWEVADVYEEGYIRPEEVKQHAKSLEDYIYRLFDAFDLPNVYQLSTIKTTITRIDEEAGETYAPYEFCLVFRVAILGNDFNEIQAFYNALDYILTLLRKRKFLATFSPEKIIKPVHRTK